MRSAIQDMFFTMMDPGITKKIVPVPIDSVVEDWELTLSSKRKVKISDVLNNSPLLLIFIRGTWCPFCRMHMKRLRDWVSSLERKKATIVIVSSESVEDIQHWLDKNPSSFMYASDEGMKLADYMKVRVKPNTYSQAATFLIDKNRFIRLAYTGKRNSTVFNNMETSLDELN